MKVINISIPYDLEKIDIENDTINVFVETEDGYTYKLSLATPKHLEFLMDKENTYYCYPGYAFIIVNKLTQDNIEQAVRAFAEDTDNEYWLNVYHFGRLQGAIDESIFDQLKAKRIAKQKELEKLDKLYLMREAKKILKDPVNKSDFIHLVEEYRSGKTNIGIGTKPVPESCLTELRTSRGISIYFREKNDIIEVIAISDKGNRERMISSLEDLYPKDK